MPHPFDVNLQPRCGQAAAAAAASQLKSVGRQLVVSCWLPVDADGKEDETGNRIHSVLSNYLSRDLPAGHTSVRTVANVQARRAA